MLLDRFQLGIDDRASIERSDRQADRQRLDLKTHTDRRSAGRNGESDAGCAEPPLRLDGTIGQGFVFCQQGTVDIGDNQCDAGHVRLLPDLPPSARPGSSWRTMSSTIALTGASIDTVIGFSPISGGSSVSNWLSSSPAGMKWPFLSASRIAINSLVPSRKMIRTSVRS